MTASGSHWAGLAPADNVASGGGVPPAVASLAENEERFRGLFMWTTLPQAVTDPVSGRLLMVNPAFCALVGYSDADLFLRTSRDLCAPADWDRQEAEVAALLSGPRTELRLLKRFLRADGSTLRASVHVSALRDEGGRVRYLHGAVEQVLAAGAGPADVVDARALGTPPADPAIWAAARRRIGRLLAAPGSGRPTQLAVVRIANLPALVGTLGFSAVEQVFGSIAARLAAAADLEVRLVEPLGPSYLLLALRAEGRSGMVTALRAVLHLPVEMAGLSLPLRPQIGLAGIEPGEQDPDRPLRRAWLAMTEAIRTGRPDVWHDGGLDGRAVADLALTGEVAPALAAGEFSLHYQLKFSLPDRRPIGAEALLRWQHPEQGLVPAEQVVRLAEESGLIEVLTCWVIDQACAQAVRWRAGGTPLPIAVNIPPTLLGSPALLAHLSRATRRHALPASSIELEITETGLATGEHTLAAVGHLHQLGYALHIDDFGTGYSTLASLKVLPRATIKIDRAFITHLDTDPRDAGVVAAIIQIARVLGHRVIAEGVESAAAAQVLTELGCHQAQGYHLHRPAPAATIALTGFDAPDPPGRRP